MCKVMIMGGIKDANRDNAIKFIHAISKPMSIGNADGLGYAAVTKDGKLFGERWLVNSTAFLPVDNSEVELYKPYSGIADSPMIETEYNSFGNIDLANMSAITLHTRMATSAKGMSNTHPFVKDGVSVIHNGVIRNMQDFKLELSTCDSEAILHQYLDCGVGYDVYNMDAAASKLEGYYACGVLSPHDGKYILDIFKSGANLYYGYVVELDTMVFCTSETDLKSTCTLLGFKIKTIMRFKDEMLLRLDATTGAVMDTKKFEVYSYAKYWPTANTKKTTEVSKHMLDYFKGQKKLSEVV